MYGCRYNWALCYVTLVGCSQGLLVGIQDHLQARSAQTQSFQEPLLKEYILYHDLEFLYGLKEVS